MFHTRIHTALSYEEIADRLAIRELIDTYAHCADRREAVAQAALFTEDAHFVEFMSFRSQHPGREFHGRDAMSDLFAQLNNYQITTHFNGQSVITLNGALPRARLIVWPTISQAEMAVGP